MPRKIAIVGANGFVGRHVLELLVQRGIEAVGIVRSEAGARVVERLGGRAIRIADLGKGSVDALIPSLRGCEGLVYTASVSPGPDASDRTDPQGLSNVIGACQTASVPSLVFLSGLGIAHYGMNPHCTNPYFLAKMAGEVALFRSSLTATVFRPSYIFGAGDEFLTPHIQRLATSAAIEIPGDGSYRLQPVSVRDTARAILGAISRPDAGPRVVDLVGPEVISYRELLLRMMEIMGRRVTLVERPVDEALAQARASRYFGMRPHDLACLLCDEVGDSRGVESLVEGSLSPLGIVLAETLAELSAGPSPT